MRLGSVLIVALINVLLTLPSSFALENAGNKQVYSFKLLGTILESDSSQSVAVFKDANSQRQSIFKIGDNVFGYQVAKIKRGEVILLKEGKTFLLGFPLGSENEPIVVLSPLKRIINRLAISKKVTDLNIAGTKVVPVPCVKAGRVIGIKIARIQDKELCKMAGIEEGDIITSINNEKLNGLRRSLEIIHSIQNKDKIFVEILRGNDIKSLVFYVN